MSRTWDIRFALLAQHVSQWSKDPSTRVGAVIVDEWRRVIATGYNGFPRGVEDTAERLNDRPTKYAMTVHAEPNAILTATASARGATLYCTHAPCADCAKLIIQAGIVRVCAPATALNGWGESQRIGMTMFSEARVRFDAVMP